MKTPRCRPRVVSATLLALTALAGALRSQTAAPAEPEETVVLDVFVVNALTDERNRSIETKRNAASIGDFLSSDRLGQFVDANIGSVVERLPGVYTSGAGQSGGSGISIRGLGGGFNSLMLDGERLPSNQGGTRGVSIDNVPAELIGAIEIFKAPTPDKEADSIGGVVNVETKSGLDLKRSLASARLLYGWDDYGSGDQTRASFSYTGRIRDRIGLFLTLTRAENERLRDEIRADPGDFVFDQLVTTSRALPQIAGANAARVFLPARVDYRRTLQWQRNSGANLNLDFQASENWRLSLRTFYARFDERRPQVRNLWRADRSTGNDPNNRSFPHPDYVYLDDRDGRTFYFGNEQRIARRIAAQEETEDIVRLQLAGVHRWKDATLDYSASFGRSTRDFWNDTFIFTADDIQLRARVGDLRRPEFSVIRSGQFAHNATANPRVPEAGDGSFYGRSGAGYFEITERRGEVIDAEDRIDAYSINYARFLGADTQFKTGLKHRVQEKTNARDFVIRPGFTFLAANAEFVPEPAFFDGLQDLGVYPSYASLRSQNPAGAREFVAAALASNPSADTRRDSTILDLGAEEDVTGAYAQINRRLGRLTLLGGMRWERTSSTYRGFTADVTGNPAVDAPRAVRGERSYSGFYPSLHANYRLSDTLLVRAAAGRTLARADFEKLTPSSYATLSADSGSGTNIVNLQRGNARLEPTESTNLDLSIERYFAKGGVASLAAFRKDLKNWIYGSTFIASPADFPEYAAVPNLSQVRVSSTLNGDEATVQGLEANLELTLGAGFSFGASYTALDFEVNAAQTGLDRVPGQSDRLIRIALNYESRRFLARISLRDSGSIVDEVRTFSSPAAIAYFQSQGMGTLITRPDGSTVMGAGLFDEAGPQLDFTAEVAVFRNARFFVQASNLLSENNATYLDERPVFAERYELRSWSALVGVKLSL